MRYHKKPIAYKYALAEEMDFATGLVGYTAKVGDWVSLRDDGLLTIAKGYYWDGPSGPAIDTPNMLAPSLVHDAFYQLMREEKLPLRERAFVDKLFHAMCLERGVWRLRAAYAYWAVKTFGERFASPTIEAKHTYFAP